MKILWVSHFLLYPETGYGALQRSRNLLLELSRRHEVFLVSYYRARDLEVGIDIESARKNLETFCREVILLPYPFDTFPANRYLALLKSLLLHLPYSTEMYCPKSLSETVVSAVKKFNIDVVHTDTIGLIESVLDRLPCRKTLNHHNIESDMMFRRSEKESNVFKKVFFLFEARKLRSYEGKYCPRYDLNLLVSELDEERLLKIAKDIKTSVIENGFDCNYFPYTYRINRSQELLFVGSLDWYPNGDAMIFFCERIWPHLKRTYPDLKLTVIGKNPPDRLHMLVENEKDIDLKGFVKDVRPFVEKARVFICPIRDGGGTRLKLLDAFAQGIPVVSTKIGAEGLDAEDGKHILIADTEEAFIKQIERTLFDDDLCMQLSLNGRRFVEERYSYQAIGEKLSHLYGEIGKAK